MTDAEKHPPLHEPFAVQEIHLDGFFSDARIDGETFRCTAFSMQSVEGEARSQPVAVVRLIMQVRAARFFIEQTAQVLQQRVTGAAPPRNRRRPG